MSEQWRTVPGYGGQYRVSDQGQVLSLMRGAPHMLSPWTVKTGHVKVRLGGRREPAGRYVHQLVLEAFVGPRPEGLVARHLNGDPTDNRPENLAWGTQSENQYDSVRHGTHPEATKTHCKRGHEFTAANTRHHKGSRYCRTCARLRMRVVRAEKYAETAPPTQERAA